MNESDVEKQVAQNKYEHLRESRKFGFLEVLDSKLMGDENETNCTKRFYKFVNPKSDQVEEIYFDEIAGKIIDEILDSALRDFDIREFLRQILWLNWPDQTLEIHELIKKYPQAVEKVKISPRGTQIEIGGGKTPNNEPIHITLLDLYIHNRLK